MNREEEPKEEITLFLNVIKERGGTKVGYGPAERKSQHSNSKKRELQIII